MPDDSSEPTPADAGSAADAIQRFASAYQGVRDQLTRVIVGQEDVIDGVLTTLFVGGNVLLEGVPGLGKTLLIRSLSEALSLEFSRIQFTPDLMPADITGTTIVVEEQKADGTTERDFQFRRGPLFAQIVLADEINRATPKTQSAMLEAMAEKSVTVGGVSYEMAKPFFVMATQNPIEQEGTYPLPEAQLDRFLFKLEVGYSDRAELHEILRRTTAGRSPTIEPQLNAAAIVSLQKLVRQVVLPPAVQDFAVRAVLATHPGGLFATDRINRFARVGASPRAAQALVLAAKVTALRNGRPHASVDDVKAVMLPALRHRVLLNFEGEAEGIGQDAVVEEIRDTLPVEAPR